MKGISEYINKKAVEYFWEIHSKNRGIKNLINLLDKTYGRERWDIGFRNYFMSDMEYEILNDGDEDYLLESIYRDYVGNRKYPDCKYFVYDIVLYDPELTLTNSFGSTHTLKDTFTCIHLFINQKSFSLGLHGLCRMSLSQEEYVNSYRHSHVDGDGLYTSRCCTGSSKLFNSSFELDAYDPALYNDWQILQEFLRTEASFDSPYRYISALNLLNAAQIDIYTEDAFYSKSSRLTDYAYLLNITFENNILTAKITPEFEEAVVDFQPHYLLLENGKCIHPSYLKLLKLNDESVDPIFYYDLTFKGVLFEPQVHKNVSQTKIKYKLKLYEKTKRCIEEYFNAKLRTAQISKISDEIDETFS